MMVYGSIPYLAIKESGGISTGTIAKLIDINLSAFYFVSVGRLVSH